jgi:uncharacterized RDD family membrane protein YckC
MSELVTGEAVELELRTARLASRSVAFALDVLVQFVTLLIVLLVAASGSGSLDDAATIAVLLVITILVLVGYPVIFETLSRGRTLGKMALGLRVVRDDGGPIRFRQALVRGLAGFFVDFWALGLLGAVAAIVSLFSVNGKRVGDYLAGTLVVRERAPEAVSPAYIAMPPHLASWAATAPVERVPNDLALAVRQYLGRQPQLTLAANEHLSSSLSADVAHYLGVTPPSGGDRYWLLNAVLAERRNREQTRLARTTYAPPAATLPVPAAQPPDPTTPPDSPFAPPS